LPGPGSGSGRLLWAAGLLAVFVAIACAVKTGSSLAGWDERMTNAFVARRTPGWSRAFWAFTLLGDSPIMGALAGSATVLLAAWGKRTAAAIVGGGVLVAFGAAEAGKALLQRARPSEAIALIQQPGSHSLPSGHALVSLVFCGLLVYLGFRWIDARLGSGARVERGARVGRGAGGGSRRGRSRLVTAKLGVAVMGAAVVVMVGASRVYLGVHWASDILAAWCLGGAWLLVAPGLFAAVRRAGGSRSLLGDSGVVSRRSVRIALVVVLALLVAVAVVLTVRYDPLLP
jgi:membrane-associated phospholipid phosphatase